MTVIKHDYWAVLILPVLVPVSLWLVIRLDSSWWAWLPLGVLFGLLPLVDYLVGEDPRQGPKRFYPATLVPLVSSAVYLVCLVVILWMLQSHASRISWVAFLGALLSQGVVSGTVAINTAHELIHRRHKALRSLGGLLLASVGYASFKIEHVRWHHLYVATDHDPSSAPRGCNIYRFMPTAIIKNTVQAWRLEKHRLERQGVFPFGWRNQMLQYTLLSIAMVFVVGWLGSGRLILFFIVQAGLAIALLEIINFIEHYGLRRKTLASGRLEPVGGNHAWSANHRVSNAVLFNLQRHADHHIHAGKWFTALDNDQTGPQLPAGYASLVLVALIPPLWRRLIHPRLDEFDKV